MKKRLLSVGLACVMAIGMTACGGNSSATSSPQTSLDTSAAAQSTDAETVSGVDATEPGAGEDGCPVLTTTDSVSIVLVHNNAANSAGGLMAEKFKEELESRSGGVISVKVYPNGESGTGPENLEAVKEGTVQMLLGIPSGVVDPSLTYFDLPCMAPDNEAFTKLFGRETELRQITEERCNAIGLELLTLSPSGFGIISSNKPVRSFEDFAGLKMRTAQNPVQMELFKSWGCSATPVDFSELYVALQQGLVEAQNNPLDGVVSMGLHEVQKYIINTNHLVIPIGLLMNLEFYNNLPEDVRALIEWVCKNVIDEYTMEEFTKAEEAAKQIALDAGLEFIDFTDEDWTKMKEAAKPVYDMVAEQVGQDLIDKINANIDALN